MTMNPTIREALDNSIASLRSARTHEPRIYASYRTLGDLLHTARCEMDEARELVARRNAPVVEAPRNADTLRSELRGAALLAGWQFGATDAQINLLVRLATQSNDFRPIVSSGALTKREASAIIGSWNAF